MTDARMVAVACMVAIATPLRGQCPDGSPPPCARALDRAREQRTHWLIALPWNPMLTPLHSDPRFAALLRSVGRARL